MLPSKTYWKPVCRDKSSDSTNRNFKHMKHIDMNSPSNEENKELNSLDYGDWISSRVAEAGSPSSDYSS